jgi:hypothetical protein
LKDVEEPKAEPVKVDTRTPVVIVTISQPQITRVDGFTVNFNVSDPMPGSGIDSVVALLDTTQVSNGQNVDVLWASLGTHTLEVTATDVAGWSTSGSGSFELIATLDSLRRLIIELRRRGEIDSYGTERDMLKVIDAAIRSNASGNRKATLQQLEALSQEASALAGNHITLRGEAVLQDDIAYVMQHL